MDITPIYDAEQFLKEETEWQMKKGQTSMQVVMKMNVPAKWHDLRKDPNDLPLRRCIDSNGDVVGLFRHSWDKKPTWYRYDFHEREWWQMETEPIAWCEIPTYTEE